MGQVACSHTPPPEPTPPPPPPDVEIPGWVLRMPPKKGRICATGAVDPTFFRQDGRTSAAETARAELARTIQVKVTAFMVDEQTNYGGYVDQVIVTEVITSVSEAVISGAEILEYWYDEFGNVSKKGMTYAFACMRTDESAAQLAERIHQAVPEEGNEKALEGVRERAKAAFDELEAMEAKKQEQ